MAYDRSVPGGKRERAKRCFLANETREAKSKLEQRPTECFFFTTEQYGYRMHALYASVKRSLNTWNILHTYVLQSPKLHYGKTTP